MSFSRRGEAAVDLIDELAVRHGPTIYDPQGDEVTRPTDECVPMDPAMAALLDELAE